MSGLLSALLGGLVALGGWGVQDRLLCRRRRNALQAALASEIASLVMLMRHQHYAEELRAHAEAVRNAVGRYHVLFIPIKQSYFSVFEANAGLVGELDRPLVVDIIAFYQQARSLADSASTKLDPDATPAAIAAQHYEQIADACEKLCTFGDSLSARLATSEVADQLKDIAARLRPAS